ncbi:MAG: DUF371 domain-containing protein [Nitrososphaerota archaeon]|nr:DUF371 domain-containing protein [Nitrososphaerota archaeon]
MVRSTHPTTIEVTTEEYLTEEGDCIIGVGASKGCAGLDSRVKERLRQPGSEVLVRLVVGGESFELRARGDPRLQLSHLHDLVIRRSDFVSDRTLAVGSDASARSIPRKLVSLLKDPRTTGRMEIEVR